MKTLQQMLRELARPDVAEFAVASDRLPCIKVGDKYEPIDDVPRATEAILEMLVAAGGSRHIEDLEAKPAQWTMRVEGIGSLGVQAVMRGGRAQARITVVSRTPAASSPAAPAPRIEAVTGPVHETAPEPIALATETPHAAVRGEGALAVDRPLRDARDAHASDVHLIPGRPLLLRIAGELVPRGTPLGQEAIEA